MNELDLNNMDVCGFLAFCLDEMRCSTGPDMGFPTEMTNVMKDNGFSVQYTCGPNGLWVLPALRQLMACSLL